MIEIGRVCAGLVDEFDLASLFLAARKQIDLKDCGLEEKAPSNY